MARGSVDGKANRDINSQIEKDKHRLNSEVKLLLLGAGESGKSTIAKQMKILHLEGFTVEERLTYKSIIHSNVISSMKALVSATKDLNIPIGKQVIDAAERIRNCDAQLSGNLTSELAQDVKALWQDDGIRKVYSRQSEFQLNDSAAYYFDNVGRLTENYTPTEQDVLRSRAKTTGIIETEFIIEKTKFKMVDVGGQRSERKKWMHCFQDVTSVIFCVAISEYDLKLYEDDQTNRMHESLKLFKEICNSKWFIDTAMILFLNKRDLFAEKIKKVDLSVTFPGEYTGGADYENAVTFIKDKFLSMNDSPKKHIYTHVTCATDTESIGVVFNAVKDIILQRILHETGVSM